MPQTVEIPNVGTVEFPDGMSEADITKVIETDILGKQTPSATPTDATPQVADQPTDWNAFYADIGGMPQLAAPMSAGGASALMKERSERLGFGVIQLDAGADIPKLDTATVSKALGTGPKTSAVIAGSQRAIAHAVEFMTTPEGVSLFGLAGVPASAQKSIAGAFAAQMATETPRQFASFVEAARAGDTEKATEALVGTGLTATFAAGAGKAAMGSAPRTAAAAQQTSERLGIVPPLTRKMAERQHGESLIDQERIKVAKQPRDVMAARDIIASPEFEFRKDPVAGPLATKINEADLTYRFQTAHDQQRIDVMRRSLDEAEQLQLTKAMKDVESGKNVNAIEELPTKVREVATEVRTFFDAFRDRVRADREASVFSELSPNEANATRAILDGVDPIEAAKANGLREPGQAIAESAAQEIKEARNWGIEDYVTHVEMGEYRVVTPDGGVIAKAETRAEAAIKADAWLKENPGVESLTIDNSFDPGVEFPTQLSRGQYFRLVQRLSDRTATDAAQIQELLHKRDSIVTVKPSDKFAGPMQKRKDVLKGEENLFDVMPLYAHVMNKKLVLDPVLKEARGELGKMQPETRTQMETLIGDVKGRKAVADKITDALLSPLGVKPFAFSRGVSTAMAITRINKLGFRPVAAAVNRVSGLQHTWVKTGTKNLAEGREWMKTPEGEAAFERNKAGLGIEATFVHEAAQPVQQGPLAKAQDVAMWMFQKAEQVNRPEAFGAFYKQAVNDYGLKGAEAEAWARNEVRGAQFTYNIASLPRMFRDPVGKLAFQFKPYFVKELEFMAGLRGPQIPRYIGSQLLIGGPQAAIYMLKTIPLFGVLGLLDDAADWLNRKAPATSHGLTGMMGVDVSPSIALQFPQDTRDLVGPTLGDIARLWTDVLGPAMAGEDRDMGDVGKWVQRLSPLSHYWSDLIESVASKDGWTFDDRGRPEYKPSAADKVKLAIGAKPLDKSVQDAESKFLRHTKEIQGRNKARLIDDFLDAVQKDDGAAVNKLLPDMAEYGITPESVRSAAKARHLEPKLRLFKSLPKAMRGEEIERFTQPQE